MCSTAKARWSPEGRESSAGRSCGGWPPTVPASCGGRGITVNAVSPGATETDLLRHTNPAAALEQVAKITPLGRLGQPDDIADVVALVASPSARWITGQVIPATGGLM